MTSTTWQRVLSCSRCGRPTSRNSPHPPKYCGVCGMPLKHPRALQAGAVTSTSAMVSLVLGVCSMAFCAPLGWVAIPLGLSAIGQIDRSGGKLKGKGVAIAGVLLAIVSNLAWLCLLFGTIV